ncbi:hypothetical protein BC941DRAFT_408753 [Chlamydoabsidia padenii]|nr:hypothetical protein BC941DRAFT_408753 [Chlamydoabsidia padenii]
MSSQQFSTMSINTMLQSNVKHHQTRDATKRVGKVKVFYSFKDSDATCLCSFDLLLLSSQDNEYWIPISLKQCLLNVCSSCPDQLMQEDYDMAIYSANIEESNISSQDSLKDVRATVIWEGHGLLSNLLRDQQNDPITVTGQISKATGEPFDYTVQVLLQLHPIRRTRSSESPVGQHLQPLQQQQQQQVLPPMKTLLATEPLLGSPYSSYSSSTSPPPPTYQPPYNQQNQAVFRPFAINQPPLRSELDFIPPLSSSSTYHPPSHQSQDHSDWSRHTNTPNPYDERNSQRFSPPLSSHPFYHPDLPPSSSFSTPLAQPDTIARRTSPSSSSSPPLSTMATSISAPASATGSGQRKTPVDTFYHQSRRKKRDTKPPNAGDVRPFIEVERDCNGRYILPVEVDSWTVLDLGTVVWDRVAFHNQRYLYPVGYCVKKWYRSMVDPHSDTQYTCQILDGGDEPIFQLEADDNPGEVWRGPTPTTVWTIAVRRAFAIRNHDYCHNPVGPDFFGLRKNTIAKMIQDLPNADKCKNYIWQNFEAITTSGTKNKAMRRSNTRVSTSSSNTSLSSNSEPSTTNNLAQSSH